MSEHTPGPWRVEGSPNHEPVYIVDDHSMRIAYVHALDERPANARLIAAAPETAQQRDELLAALEWLVSSEFVNDAVGKGNLEGARRAIAKARGE